MLSIENLFVMDPFIMETRRLVDLGKQMNLAGKALLEFVRAKQALARDEIIMSGRKRRAMKRRLLQKQRRLGNTRKKSKRGLDEERRRSKRNVQFRLFVECAPLMWMNYIL